VADEGDDAMLVVFEVGTVGAGAAVVTDADCVAGAGGVAAVWVRVLRE